MCKDMAFCHLQKCLGSYMVKKIINKIISASKRLKIAAKEFNESKYGKTLKKVGLKVGKLPGQQISEKIIPAAVDLAGSKIADKITSLKLSEGEPQEEIQEEQEIIIPPEKRQQIIDDLRLF